MYSLEVGFSAQTAAFIKIEAMKDVYFASYSGQWKQFDVSTQEAGRQLLNTKKGTEINVCPLFMRAVAASTKI